MSKFAIRHIVTLNYTADDWELFTSEPGAEAAAMALNAKFEELVNNGGDRDTVRKGMSKLMAQYSDLGAQDSEPVWFLHDLLDKVFKKC
jgi:hypothetical protein